MAIFPASKLPTLSKAPIKVAGDFVRASKALDSDKPFSIAFRRLAEKSVTVVKSAVVKQKLIPSFSKVAALVGANSQCFKSSKPTNLSSLGSSTSIAAG